MDNWQKLRVELGAGVLAGGEGAQCIIGATVDAVEAFAGELSSSDLLQQQFSTLLVSDSGFHISLFVVGGRETA